MSDIVESWKHVEGYEGVYAVSNLGRVRNVRSGKVLQPITNNKGYHEIYLWVNGTRKIHKVHRLVAIAFVPNPDPERRRQVDHIDTVREHNVVSNLRWVSVSENQKNARKQSSRLGLPPSSVLKGVTFHRRDKKWQASITQNGKIRHLGYFSSEIDAARAYDAAARSMYGEYARVNFDDGE